MNLSAVSAAAEVAGVNTVVVSLIYLAVQVRQNNKMAIAESERELLDSWNKAIAGLTSDNSTTSIFLRGLDNFSQMTNEERMRFSTILSQLINVYISAVRMDAKNLVDAREVEIYGDICFAMILTPGGREWWSQLGPYFTVFDLFNERIEREGDSFSTWTDMIPFAKPG